MWVTEVPALDHISTFGQTRDEALRNTVDLIEGYLEAAAKEGIEVPDEGAAPQLVKLEVGAA